MSFSLDGATNFVMLWDQSCKRYADRVAFIQAGEEYTYFEVGKMVNSFARNLREDFSVQPGERIAIVLPNSVAFVVAYLAVQKIGAIPVPLNTRLKGSQFSSLLAFIKPVAVITSQPHKAIIEPLLESLTFIKYRIGLGINEPDWDSFEEMASNWSGKVSSHKIEPTDIATIIFTSGTTGKPKGALIRHCDLLWNIKVTCDVFNFHESDVHMLLVPMFHCTGLESIFPGSVYKGSTCIIDEQISPSYISDLVEKHSATTLITVPTVLYLLSNYSAFNADKFATLRMVGFSGSPIRADSVAKLLELFPNCELRNFYGLTETTSIITAIDREGLSKYPDSIGKALPYIKADILEKGVKCPVGKIGEIMIDRSHIVSGYWQANELLESRITDGLFKTGDLAECNEDGYFFLRGRNIDLIIVGGENVFAQEVEAVLGSHPNVRESAVIGIPNRIFGEVVKAFVVPTDPANCNLLELKKYCFERLPSYKVPIEIELLKELPRTPSGKIIKSQLREMSNAKTGE